MRQDSASKSSCVSSAGAIERRAIVEEIKSQFEAHLESLRLDAFEEPNSLHNGDKSLVRFSHSAQRAEFLAREKRTLSSKVNSLLSFFAEGSELVVGRIAPQIVLVRPDTVYALLFRLATTLWSVPVSRGYGRRMRFLVLDNTNGKLIGIFALGDPVFNLRVRDKWIGWTVRDREQRLVNVMDAYVVGAVPPYSQILGGKLVTCLIGSAEVSRHFEEKYSNTEGIISGERKKPRLALVTVTSALGRSSLYNRVKLPGLVELQRVGETAGWGHFHVPNPMFSKMRRLLEIDGHPYTTGYKYGSGPNWRMRVIRKALETIGMSGDAMRHGITREVFGLPLAPNWREYLQGRSEVCTLDRPSVSQIAAACLTRWIIPRAERRPDFRSWTAQDTREMFSPLLN